jgi:hypothetical protein
MRHARWPPVWQSTTLQAPFARTTTKKDLKIRQKAES